MSKAADRLNTPGVRMCLQAVVNEAAPQRTPLSPLLSAGALHCNSHLSLMHKVHIMTRAFCRTLKQKPTFSTTMPAVCGLQLVWGFAAEVRAHQAGPG